MPEPHIRDRGVALQCALRALLVVFVGTTLLFEPPTANL